MNVAVDEGDQGQNREIWFSDLDVFKIGHRFASEL